MYIVLEQQNDGSYLSVPKIEEESSKEAVVQAKNLLGHGTYVVAKMVSLLELAPPVREPATVAKVISLNPRKKNGAQTEGVD